MYRDLEEEAQELTELADIRERLEELVDRRVVAGLVGEEHALYHRLCRRERELLEHLRPTG